jgi:predicted amidophosphoribosyltransferase
LSNFAAPAFDSAARGHGAWGALAAAATRLARSALRQSCTLCAADAGDALVCPACAGALPRLARACPVCASPAAGAAACGRCLSHPPPFVATVAAFVYAFPVDRLLQQLKYGGRLAHADWAAGELAAAVAAARSAHRGAGRPDFVAAMPLAPARQRARGFNQAHEIGVRTARALGLPLVPALTRTTHGTPQAALRWSERARNVRGAFACRAGAAQVEAWVVARTLPPAAA